MILSNDSSYVPLSDTPRRTYRLPIIVVVLVTSLVFALAVMQSSNSSPQTLARDEFERLLGRMPDDPVKSAKVQELLKNDCPRIRRDWHDLNETERNLYIDAYWEMYKRGYMRIFYKLHVKSGIHSLPSFLAWHRFFIYTYETGIRRLGGRFRCFAFPYWDWTRMSGKHVAANPLWNDGFGHNGHLSARDIAYHNKTGTWPYHSSDRIQGGCVLDGRFGKSTGYRTAVGDCLRRQFYPGTHWYTATEQNLRLIAANRTYVGFETQLNSWHTVTHLSVGGILSKTRVSPQEPIFFLIHSYVDLMWALRSDCHGYDYKADWRTNENVFDPAELNETLPFPFIDTLKWSIAHYERLTPAKLMNFPQFGIQYDLSDMFQRTYMQLPECEFTYFNPGPMRPLPPGTVRVPDSVLAHRACLKAFKGCEYQSKMYGCSNISQAAPDLKAILNYPKITQNQCVLDWRMVTYKIVKDSRHDLFALCDGKYDPVCAQD